MKNARPVHRSGGEIAAAYARKPEHDPPEAQRLRERLVEQLVASGDVRDPRVRGALNGVPRHLFVPAGRSLDMAYANRPLSIGHGQTISQPAVVALMTEALELSGPEKVLEIGTGSGYQAAVLSVLAREVYSIELLPELARRSATCLSSHGYDNVHVRQGDGFQGWADEAPFDRIIATAAVATVPAAWFDQLADGGVLVAPVGGEGGQRLFKFRMHGGRTTEEDLGWVAFVPCRHQAEVR